MDIVVDKSFLQACKRSDIERLIKNHRLIMPDTLFYELVTTDDDKRIKCFSKIPEIENPMDLVPNIGALLRYENENKKPSYPLRKRRIDIKYVFNKRLTSEEFEFSKEQKAAREQQECDVARETKEFIERFVKIYEVFPDLHGCSTGKIVEKVNSLLKVAYTDHKFVKDVYSRTIGNANYPINVSPENIGKNWAVFRWVQLQLIYSLRLYAKYQGDMPRQTGDKFWVQAEHDLLDSHYIVLACLAGGIASKDKNLVEIYRSINTKALGL